MLLDPPFALFVYGTLKRGGKYHSQYCAATLGIEPACAVGRLWHLTPGYPMLEVPAQSILALGTADAKADARRQSSPRPTRAGRMLPRAGWNLIEGELLRFSDAAMLEAIDGLEGFLPDAGEGEYWRVLVELAEPVGRRAWTYVAPGGVVPAAARACGNRWP